MPDENRDYLQQHWLYEIVNVNWGGERVIVGSQTPRTVSEVNLAKQNQADNAPVFLWNQGIDQSPSAVTPSGSDLAYALGPFVAFNFPLEIVVLGEDGEIQSATDTGPTIAGTMDAAELSEGDCVVGHGSKLWLQESGEGGPITPSDGLCLARISTSGQIVWHKDLKPNQFDNRVSGVAVDSEDNIFATLAYSPNPPEDVPGSTHLFKLNEFGNTLWTREVDHDGANLFHRLNGVAVDDEDNVIVGRGMATGTGSSMTGNLKITKYSGINGGEFWTREVETFTGLSGPQSVPYVTTDSEGNVLWSTTVTFNTGPNANKAIIGKLSPDGQVLWSWSRADLALTTGNTFGLFHSALLKGGDMLVMIGHASGPTTIQTLARFDSSNPPALLWKRDVVQDGVVSGLRMKRST